MKRTVSIRKQPRETGEPRPEIPASLADIAHLIGSVEGLPSDLSNTKKYLKLWGYGSKRRRE